MINFGSNKFIYIFKNQTYYYPIFLITLLLNFFGGILFEARPIESIIGNLIYRYRTGITITNSLNFSEVRVIFYFVVYAVLLSGITNMCLSAERENKMSLFAFLSGVKDNCNKMFLIVVIFEAIFYIISQATVIIGYIINSNTIDFMQNFIILYKYLLIALTSYIICTEGFTLKNYFIRLKTILLSSEVKKLFFPIIIVSIVVAILNYQVQMFLLSKYQSQGNILDITRRIEYPFWINCLHWIYLAFVISYIFEYASIILDFRPTNNYYD